MKTLLKNIWGWINSNSAGVQAIATVVIVVFTLFSVIFSYQLIKEQERQSGVAYRSYVFIQRIYLMWSDARVIGVDIKNAGQTPAEKLKFNAYAQIANHKVPLNMESKETSLGPNQEMTLDLPSSEQLISAMSSSTSNHLTIEIDYKDFQNNEYKSLNTFSYTKDINGRYFFANFEQDENKN